MEGSKSEDVTTTQAAVATSNTEPEKSSSRKDNNNNGEIRVPQNIVNISWLIKAQLWATRIRTILKFHETVTLGALGRAMLTLTDTVETLKREKVAVVRSITTSQIEIDVGGGRKVNKAKLNVVLERGPSALLLFGYRRRRVLSLFDELYRADESNEGKDESFDTPENLKIDIVKQLDFAGLGADEPSKAKSSQYLEDLLRSKPDMSAIEFLTYISFLVSPKLANSAFDETINKLSNREK